MPETETIALTEQQIRSAAAFDQHFGSNAYDFLKGGSEAKGYKFSARTADGREMDQMLTAPNADVATRQSWDVIEEQDRNGTEIATARIEWSDEEGPQVSYIYDRQQGFELNRPWGIVLTHEAQLVAQTINEAQENGALRIGTDQQTVVAAETNEVVEKPTEKEMQSALVARSALETERQNILMEAQTPHEVGLDGALKSYVNGRADAYNNIRNALAESSAVELPKLIEPEEINVAPPTLAIDDRQQSLALSI